MINVDKRTVFEVNRDCFDNYMAEVPVYLEKNDGEYREIMNENRKILKDYPRIQDMFEDDKPISLNEEECKAIIKYQHNWFILKSLEQVEVFFVGFREGYYYLKKCHLIKEDI